LKIVIRIELLKIKQIQVTSSFSKTCDSCRVNKSSLKNVTRVKAKNFMAKAKLTQWPVHALRS